MKKIFIFATMFLLFTNLFGDLIKSFNYSETMITTSKMMDYDQVFYDKFDLTSVSGNPQLPFEIFHLDIGSINGYEILEIEYEKIRGNVNLFPVQKPQILSIQTVEFQPSGLSKIQSQMPFPEEPLEILHSGKLSGSSIASFRVFPLKYENNQLFLLKTLKVKFKTNSSGKDQIGYFPVQNQIISKLANSEISKNNSTNEEINEYIIITSQYLVESFEPLRQWKNKKGLSAITITTEWIESNYSGDDLQEKIRNCIKDFHQTKSTSWVLLGGDTDIIPDRKAWAFDCEANYAFGENDIPCDLYYSDLDGTWNEDNDDIYGEIDDNIDIYPDVFVGRATVENTTEADAFVSKVLAYEKALSRDYQSNMMFLAQVLWREPYTNSGESKDLIDEQFVPEQYDPIQKLYEHTGTARKSDAVKSITNGVNIINHDGHAWYSSMSLGGGGSFGYADMASLNNPDKYGILYSIGCWPAAFDHDAVAEDFITNPTGGGVAFIGNSRYGWGSPGNPLFGYSDRFDQQFFKNLFIDHIYNIGATLAATKSYYAPLSCKENVYRWCQYEINLLGDPEMPIFTNLPDEMIVNYPKKIGDGKQAVTISVTDSINPIPNCTVCLRQEEGIYFVGKTGIDGIVKFNGNIEDITNEIDITVTAHNFVPYENKIEIVSSKAFISITDVISDELFTGIPNNGDILYLNPTIKNTGSKASENIYLRISSINPTISMVDSFLDISVLNAGDSMIIENAITFYFTDTICDKESFNFRTSISDKAENYWESDFSITASLPNLKIVDMQIDKEFLQPGDSFQTQMVIRNTGTKFCEEYSILFETNENLIISNFLNTTNGLLPNESDTVIINMQIVDATSNKKFFEVDLSFLTVAGYEMIEQFGFSIGGSGFSDDFEDESGFWTFSTPTTNQWTRSQYRKYSGDYSFYCGNDELHYYNFTNTRNYAESDYFYPGKNPKLSFYCWYEFPNYGVSGLNVEVFHNGDWKRLDFIGSGGALGILPTGNDWMKYEYDLSFLSEMTKTKLRFLTLFDPSEPSAEGVYVDDLKVSGESVIFTNTEHENILPEKYSLHQNYPNPFNPSTNISFSMPKSAIIKLTIYNLQGNVVEELVSREYSAGNHIVLWNAQNHSSGIYFYKMETEDFVKVNKCLFIK